MNKTFFIRVLDNGNILVKNNDINETKILADTDMLSEYIDDYIESLKDKEKNGNTKIQKTTPRS